MTRNEDHESLERIWEGDGAKPHDAAVQRAVVEVRQEIMRFLENRLRDRDEAEEVLQRFTLRALERSFQLRDVRTMRGWLGRILATTIIDHQRDRIRRRKRETAVDPDSLENHSTESDQELDATICNCLYRLLPTIKAEYADIIWRADILGEPRDRLAASLGTSLNNVTVRLHRGRRALRKRLEEMCRTCPIHGFLDCYCEKAEQIAAARAVISNREEPPRDV
ncbi:RNA polymerase subunit sigma-70 (plasmid) [Rhizobium rosettiformans]|uniref:RNA polymerase subunit sigma-70 n=1 Tax=Rhizobium rosettiformans TaxID=1368430 RepID=A0ABX7F3C0_9HYPH|nr:sigma factor-like helix-turn-helix DNA-binding protein [Rhizobium rosettiformans]QRF54608.1 RNA polymerase subunit sigma-70 [Rhizobium rosettiformans]